MFNMQFKYGITDPQWDAVKATRTKQRIYDKLTNGKTTIQKELEWVRRHFLQGDDIRMTQEEAWGVLLSIEQYVKYEDV